MSGVRRARTISVCAVLAAGAIGIISSTQTWLTVELTDGAAEPLAVAGADAVAVLAPLSLTALALGAVLTLVGRALRYLLGVIVLALAVALGLLTIPVAVSHPLTAASATVTEATGIAGEDAVADLVAGVGITLWPAVTVGACALLLAAGVFILATAATWPRTGRRYRTTAAAGGTEEPEAPRDSIDSWDDLSRGDDPTR